MIIFGFRSRESTVDFGSFHCPRCGSQQSYSVIGVRRWFTLYFIPIIPLQELGRYVQCGSCGGTFEEGVLTKRVTHSDGVLVAALADEDAWSPSPQLDRAPTHTQNSSLAILSLIAGIVSLPLVCVCGLSTLSSLAAIISGHVALIRIKRSAGALAGRGAAIGGVSLGYFFLLISLATLPFMWQGVSSFQTGWQRAKERQAAGIEGPGLESRDARLDRVERAIMTDNQGIAQGNTPRARELAAQFSKDLKRLRETLFTGSDKPRVSLTGGDFITHCELHESQCAFVVHVPAYRNFEDDAKESLAELAWHVAQQTVQDDLEPGDSLAVGLKGTVLYGAILVGEVAAGAEENSAYEEVERDELCAFFPANQPSVIGEATARVEIAATEEQPAADQSPPAVLREEASQPRDDAARMPQREAEAIDSAEATSRDPFFDAPISPAPQVTTPSVERATPAVEMRPGNLVQEFRDLGWAVNSLAFSPDGKWLAAGKMDSILLLFDIATGQTLSTHKDLRQLGSLTALAFSKSGEQLVVGGGSGAIQVWKVGSDGTLESPIDLIGHKGSVRFFAIRDDFAFVVSGGDDKRLMWQPTVSNGSMRVNDHFQRKVMAAFLPPQGTNVLATDGQQLASIDLKKSTTGSTQPLSRGPVHAVAFSPDGTLVACSEGYDIHLWDTDTGKPRQLLKTGEIQWSLQFAPDGHRLLSGGRGKVTVWDWNSGEPASTISLGDVLYIQTLAVSRDGRYLAAIPSAAGQTLRVFRLDESDLSVSRTR